MSFLDGSAKRQVKETSEFEVSQKLIVWYLVVAADYEGIGMKNKIEIFSTATILDLLQHLVSTTPWMTPFEDMVEIQQNPDRKRLPGVRSVNECGSTPGNPLLVFIPTRREVIVDSMLRRGMLELAGLVTMTTSADVIFPFAGGSSGHGAQPGVYPARAVRIAAFPALCLGQCG